MQIPTAVTEQEPVPVPVPVEAVLEEPIPSTTASATAIKSEIAATPATAAAPVDAADTSAAEGDDMDLPDAPTKKVVIKPEEAVAEEEREEPKLAPA